MNEQKYFGFIANSFSTSLCTREEKQKSEVGSMVAAFVGKKKSFPHILRRVDPLRYVVGVKL